MKQKLSSLYRWFIKLSFPSKLLVLVIFVGLGYLGYSKFTASKTATPQYQTSTAEIGNLIVSLSVSGQVSASNSRTVTTTASGVVKRIFVKEGQKVSTGSPILEIDLDLNGRQKLQSAYSAYQSAQNSLKSSQDKFYSLQSDLVATKNVFDNQWSMQSPDDPTYIQKHNAYLSAQAAFDNLANTIKQQQAALEAARLAYQAASATVYAPISGTVSAISLTPGMILNPTSDSSNSSNIENKIAIVKTNATPAITVSLTEIDVPKTKVGNKATIDISALPDKTFTGKVIAIDTLGTTSNGVVNYPTTIQLDSESPDILANMSATGSIILNVKNDVLLVPSSSVVKGTSQNTVRMLKDGHLINVPVEVGLVSDTQTEIISGLNPGDTVVTSITSATAPARTTNTSVFSSFGGGGNAVFRGR